jgi:RecA/RadA recombinase
MSLLDTLANTGSIKSVPLDQSTYMNEKDLVNTDVPIINIAFSGDVNGGFSPGLTVISGESKTFKSMISLYALKAYQQKYPDSVCLFYDSEFGVTTAYLENFGIDTAKVLHIPVENVEQLKFDLVHKLESIKRKDNVFILLDSLGNLASKKEVDDAMDEKSVADMSRAKAIRSMLRIITPHLTMKDVPCFMINHVYQTIGMFATTVIPGGTAITYSANTVWVIGKSQIKDGKNVTGYQFTINIHKSRMVKEKSKFPFTVDMDTGIGKYSGLLEIAIESGHVVKPSNGWYSNTNTLELKHRAKDLQESFWVPILEDITFQEFVKRRYKYGNSI